MPAAETDDIISLAVETARIDTRIVETGRTAIRTSVSEREEVVTADLVRHDVEIERVPVGRVVTEVPVPHQDGDFWVVPVVEERLVIEKQLVLKEMVRVRTTSHREAVKKTVRLREEHVTVETTEGEAT